MSTRPIAHVARDADGGWREPHDLADHLHSVGELAAAFAARFGGADYARQAGRWHDLGKFRARFQSYIRQASGFDAHIVGEAGKAPHSTAGAVLAMDRFEPPCRVLAYLIAGHHAGLPNWSSASSTRGLDARLSAPQSLEELQESLAQSPPPDLLDPGAFTGRQPIPGNEAGVALWIRMLFSALVDADFLDTERYMDPASATQRQSPLGLDVLADRFDRYMDGLLSTAEPTPVNVVRARVFDQCRNAATRAPGVFTLTVPTGGGKTLSGMAFALEHARRHGKRRIIYVIPYTSIIEQTADIFRGIFGDGVIEHHSNAEVDPGSETPTSRLACENWDAPIVVTTNVQFFESLFASRTSRCRKLHNIVDSVVVLDEAQLLPRGFLQPILDVLKLLTEHYGVTLLLSTATQPTLASTTHFDTSKNLRGLDGSHEIVVDPDVLADELERVKVRLPADWDVPTSWPALAAELSSHPSVLAIVNTRKGARELWECMPVDTVHLSALMCGAHRSQVIADIKQQLDDGVPTRVVSTQVVEAGVDIDFPVVYRALAGLDSMAQAAGRCNREGRLNGKGDVVVFVPPTRPPPGLLRQGADAGRDVLHGVKDAPFARRHIDAYFRRLYYRGDLDEAGIGALLTQDARNLEIEFRAAAEAFRIIDEDSQPVVVLYRGADGNNHQIDQWIGLLRSTGPKRWLMRKLQRYTVSVPFREISSLEGRGDIEQIQPGLFVQRSPGLYHPTLGLLPEGAEWNAGGWLL